LVDYLTGSRLTGNKYFSRAGNVGGFETFNGGENGKK